VKSIGESEIYIELPQSDPSLINSTMRVLSKQGRFEGIVDGKVAVSDDVIMPGSIREENPYVQGQNVRWEVGFAITEAGAVRFADVVKGKANYPVYMFLDRPEDSVVLLSRSELIGNSTLTETEALSIIHDVLRKENESIPVFVTTDWEAVKEQLSLLNRSKYNKTIISSNTDASRIAELKAMGFEVVLKDPADMTPTYTAHEEQVSISEWRAVGLLSAPVLNPEITQGRINRFYSISGFAPANLPMNAKLEYAKAEIKNLKSILSGGALPVHIIIGTPTTIPAPLGEEFLKYSLVAAFVAVLVIIGVITVRYGLLEIAPLIFITVGAELLLLICILGGLGTIDLGAMAGIIGAIGSGVDAQILITDEMLEQARGATFKRRLENAFHIIMTNATVAVIAMIPLLFFSGLVEIIGFALSIIFGAFIGAFITRPAYGAMLEFVLKAKGQQE
jgi:preprotein translocase subunit SecD